MPIDINWFREDKGGDVAKLRESQRRRGKPESQVDAVIEADKLWRKLDFDVNQLNKKQNELSGATGKAKVAQKKANEAAEKAKKEGKWSDEDEKKLKGDIEKLENDCKKYQEEVKEVQAAIEKTKAERDNCKAKLQKLLNIIGNIVADDVPISMNEDENQVVVVKGEKKAANGKKLFHHELLYMIDGFEPDRGVTVAGHRAYFLKGPGVLLNQALINYGIQFLMKHKYTALQPPFFMKKDIMAETAQLEEFDEALYHVKGSDSEEFYLIATSEQPISAYHRGETLHESQLPVRYSGISSCFRKEAGSHGKDVAGIFRIHQFEKVEQFVVCSPYKSWEMHQEMVKVSQDFYDSLGLSYQVISIVSGALNNAAAKKLDLEAWFPARGVYRELVSCSNCTDYQSRAMDTKFSAASAKGDKGDGKKQEKKEQDAGNKYVHMLNATLCATERTICCLLENYQTENGVAVPEVLKPFTGGIEFFPFVREMPKQWKENREKEEKEAAKAATGKTEKQ